MEPQLAEAVAHIDMSPYALFMQADWVVKSVMLGLLVASVVSWAIIFSKLGAFARARAEMRRFEKAFAAGEPLSQLHERLKARPVRGLSAIFVAAMEEWTGSHAAAAATTDGLVARLRLVLDGAIAAEAEKLEEALPFLATVGSAAPFVGLFGTVWGIYNALITIGSTGQASIDKVAGPVGEALIMTALGLAVAVPAVLGYNWLVRRNKVAMDTVRGFGSDLHTVLLAANAKKQA